LKILIIGGGGREHTLVWKIAQSPKVTKLYVAPGNAGTAQIAENLDIRPTEVELLAKASRDIGIDLTIVGPEAPLANGIVDHFNKLDLPIFGPTKAAARIESSKVFAKQLMHKYGIPCPTGVTFSEYDKANAYLKTQTPPIVVKANGLAAGKGVTIAMSEEEAQKALSDAMKAKVFGSAGDSVLIEEYVMGKEVSLLVFTDGKTVIPMVPACDYKRVFDSDQGLNTGGMGSYSPPGFFSDALFNQALNNIIIPTVKALASEGTPYQGILYTGLIIAPDGPKVLEFNARFGDPETQVILPRLNSDLADIMLSVINGKLHETAINWSNSACVGVVMASGGYPGDYKTGFLIEGLDNIDDEIMVFHAGTKLGGDSRAYTDGGRVLTVAAIGKTIAEAREKVYQNITRIHFPDGHYRKDIAAREVK